MQLTTAALQMQRLLQLRWTEITGQMLAVLVAIYGLGLPLRVEGLLAVCLLLAAINLFSHWRLTQRWPVSRSEVFFQLCIDVLALALLLYQSGGASNPFSSLLLVPLTVTAAMLTMTWVWAMAAVTALVFSLLLIWHQPLPTPSLPLDGLNDLICTVTGIDRSLLDHDNGFSLHVVGMWINFLLSAAIVTVFVTRIAAVLRQREKDLARAREGILRQERLLAIGTLAAGTAHQLGTPLATMAVVLHELQRDHVENAALQEDLSLLRKQVDHCKHILSVLADKASQSAISSTSTIAVQALIARVLEQWQLLRPGTPLAVIDMVEAELLAVADDPALDQALLNLLDNAADASGQAVTLRVQAKQEGGRSWCRIEILDQGPGIDDAVVARLGEPFITTKGETGGMGIGLFLSNATLERLGGRVEIVNREEGGACTRVLLPALEEKQA